LKISLDDNDLREPLELLSRANAATAERYPGDSGARQPVHTVYGGAQLFKHDTAIRLGNLAERSLKAFAPDPETFGRVLELPLALREVIYDRVCEKLEREPVEDFRIDFEDGYGHRPDEEEDGHAVSTAAEVARGIEAGTLPPFLGIRIKTLSEELKRRSLRTLDLFYTSLVEKAGSIPENFVVTLPKITDPAQVRALAEVLSRLEDRLQLASGRLRFELMIETPQSIFAADGRIALPELIAASDGRCSAAHFGTYDYTANCDITAAHQHMTHPACDFARHVMQVGLSGTGVWISDGATNVLPVAPHRASPEAPLTPEQETANRDAVHAAWNLHSRHVRHSLVHAIYQGWDLHPAQLPTRYATVYAFFLEGLEAAGERLTNFVAQAAQATLVGDVFDDAATGQGLLNYFLRAISCGAISEKEALERSGLTLEELQSRSFLEILEARKRHD